MALYFEEKKLSFKWIKGRFNIGQPTLIIFRLAAVVSVVAIDDKILINQGVKIQPT